ncbi:MAG: signal peptide peptidase SppA [Sphingomonadales bacterium]|nr:signal peptide peptidase SppA [Sphingomonadales bacterium]
MIFARKVWHLLVAIKDGLVLMLLLLFFALLSAALASRPNPVAARAGALLVTIDGPIVEEPKLVDPLALLFSGGEDTREYRERDLVRAISGAADDSRIHAVVLDLSKFAGGGQVHLEAIGAAMDRVRAARKPVLVYATIYEDAAMLLAAHASEVWVDPLGGAFLPGPGGYNLYYAKLLDRLKIDAHVFRVGTYKDYVEPFIRNDMSAPARDARTALYGALWSDWRANVAAARPRADIARVTSDPVGWLKAAGGDAAKAALAAGLVDHIGNRSDFGQRVVQIVGADSQDSTPGAFAHSDLDSWLAAHPPAAAGRAIGVVTVAGEITDGKAGPGEAGGDRIAALIDRAAAQDIAALVVRVDSPGGSVMASEAIRSAIARLKARGLPVAVSMANVAASGGYWVSTPGTRIFAQPATITGSIGIFAVVPSFERALAAWGVTGDGVRTTPLSGQPDVVTGLTPEVEAMLQADIDSGYRRFIGLVATARHKTPAEIDAIGQGRVWDGGAARRNGLVDQFGGLDDALAWTAAQAHLRDGAWHAVFLGEKPQPLQRLVAALRRRDDDAAGEGASGRDWVGTIAARQQALLARAIAGAGRVMAVHGAEAYCLDCVDAAPSPAPDGAPATLLGRLGHLFGLS